MPRIILKPGRDKPVRQRHPWVFSGAVGRWEGTVEAGDLIDVFSGGGEFLARGYANRESQIVARLLTWDPEAIIDAAFWRARLERAVAGRDPRRSACRLVHGEADGLPGLVIDRYDRWLVLQALTAGVERRKGELAALAAELTGAKGVYERSDADVRPKEGLPPATGVLWGEQPPEVVEIAEPAAAGPDLRFLVDVRRGHKTGFYLDQSENRRLIAARCPGLEVLNLFAYTGAFGCHALAQGAAAVTQVDSSAEALELARRHVLLNGQGERPEDFLVGDCFGVLRQFRAQGRRFDVVILDPPKFVKAAAQVQKGARAYKDLSLVAMQILRPGGWLATFSCSGLVSPDLFQKIVFGASVDAGRDAQILAKLSQADDHPILLSFPEGEYLKGLLCRVW